MSSHKGSNGTKRNTNKSVKENTNSKVTQNPQNDNKPSCGEKEQLVNIYSEAFYLALKKIESEKEKQSPQAEKISKKEKIAWMAKFLLLPWILSSKKKVREDVYDTVLTFVVSTFFLLLGMVIWSLGIAAVIGILIDFWQGGALIEKGILLAGMILTIILGSLLIISGNVFAEEKDSSKIYAYSASIFTLVSCIIGANALFRSFK